MSYTKSEIANDPRYWVAAESTAPRETEPPTRVYGPALPFSMLLDRLRETVPGR